jgi:hypothetical protein
VGLTVGSSNDMSVVSEFNEVEMTSMERIHKEVITTFCDRVPYNWI